MRKFISIWVLLIANVLHALSAYELSIAAIFQNEGPYLKEWIEYHRMVGVEHFWLYNDKSTDNWKEVLQPYITKGIVEVIDWPSPSPKDFIVYQCNAYKDALKKTTGITKWLALIDIDEFLLPMEEKTVPQCLNKHFANAAGVYVNWHHFGTGGITLKDGEPLLFRLTACSRRLHLSNRTGKSIVRPDCIDPNTLWNPHHMIPRPGTQYYNGNAEPLNFVDFDLKYNWLDRNVYNKFIRLNHYTMRDEKFFHNVRLMRARGIGIPEAQVWEKYHAFNRTQDFAITKFIKKKHPKMYKKLWKHPPK